jgi:hypothetical protein
MGEFLLGLLVGGLIGGTLGILVAAMAFVAGQSDRARAPLDD